MVRARRGERGGPFVGNVQHRGVPEAPPTTLVEVPRDALTRDALRGIIEEFVTRAGTDYGTHEKSIEEKIRDVERQLERGDARIVFDVDAQTANIVPAVASATR